jgi:hypothetical protein
MPDGIQSGRGAVAVRTVTAIWALFAPVDRRDRVSAPAVRGANRRRSPGLVPARPAWAPPGARDGETGAPRDLHSSRAGSRRKIRQVRRKLERCGECTPAARCANHQTCASQRDAALAAEIGAAWAMFVRGQVDVRRPWPSFRGRVAAIALRLVTELAVEPRRSELARICHWRAGLKWEALERPRIRDRPYENPDGASVICKLPGALRIQSRTRRQTTSAPERFDAIDALWPRRRG